MITYIELIIFLTVYKISTMIVHYQCSLFICHIISSTWPFLQLEIIQTHSKIPQNRVTNVLQSSYNFIFSLLLKLLHFNLQRNNFGFDEFVIRSYFQNIFILFKGLLDLIGGFIAHGKVCSCFGIFFILVIN